MPKTNPERVPPDDSKEMLSELLLCAQPLRRENEASMCISPDSGSEFSDRPSRPSYVSPNVT